jgi:hypothetical protein
VQPSSLADSWSSSSPFLVRIGSIEIVGRTGLAQTAAFGTVICAVGIRLAFRTSKAIKGGYDPVVLDPHS